MFDDLLIVYNLSSSFKKWHTNADVNIWMWFQLFRIHKVQCMRPRLWFTGHQISWEILQVLSITIQA